MPPSDVVRIREKVQAEMKRRFGNAPGRIAQGIIDKANEQLAKQPAPKATWTAFVGVNVPTMFQRTFTSF